MPPAASTARFASRTAWGGNAAIRRASRSTNGPISAAGSARLIQPYRSASSRVEILAAEHDFERPAPAHEAWEALGAAPAGEDADRDLGLAEDRPPDRPEPEIEREHELASPAAGAPFELGDRDLRERPPPLHEHVDELELLGAVGPVAWERLDEPEVRMRDEELGVGAPHDDRAHVAVASQLAGELRERADEHGVEQVDGRMVEGHERDPFVDVDSQTLVLVRTHGPPPRSGTRRTGPAWQGSATAAARRFPRRRCRVGSTYW